MKLHTVLSDHVQVRVSASTSAWTPKYINELYQLISQTGFSASEKHLLTKARTGLKHRSEQQDFLETPTRAL